MPRPKSTEIEIRDAQIRADAAKGMPKVSLAAKYGRSVTRICQILAADTEGPDEEHRAWLWVNYQGGMDRLQEIIESPGRPVTSGKGEHVIDANTGLPAYDTSTVTDAIRTKFQGLKSMAQLLGSEKTPAKPFEAPPDFQAHLDWVGQAQQEIQALNARAKETEALKDQVRFLRQQLAAAEEKSMPVAEIVEG